MGSTTSIEWTKGPDGTPGATWNPVTGCTKVSPGCDNCYAETLAERFRGTPGHYFERGFDVQLREDKLDLPLRWRKPRRIFVNSMSDLFHDSVPDEYIARVFAVMALTERHTFQVLTKRHARMRSLLNSAEFAEMFQEAWENQPGPDGPEAYSPPWPLPNVWLGVSGENQQWADIRIPALLDTPAAVRFVSAEPLLGPIDLTRFLAADDTKFDVPPLNWVIAGGESGRGARPMHPDWARSLRDQCQTAGVAFHFKQWGEWITDDVPGPPLDDNITAFRRVGRKAAGRELDGRTWDEFPRG